MRELKKKLGIVVGACVVAAWMTAAAVEQGDTAPHWRATDFDLPNACKLRNFEQDRRCSRWLEGRDRGRTGYDIKFHK